MRLGCASALELSRLKRSTYPRRSDAVPETRRTARRARRYELSSETGRAPIAVALRQGAQFAAVLRDLGHCIDEGGVRNPRIPALSGKWR